jgi:hypothetical protein
MKLVLLALALLCAAKVSHAKKCDIHLNMDFDKWKGSYKSLGSGDLYAMFDRGAARSSSIGGSLRPGIFTKTLKRAWVGDGNLKVEHPKGD